MSAKRGETDFIELKIHGAGCRVTVISSCCLVLTDAGSLVLGEARRTLAGEASDGVDAVELAVVLLGRTFIQILEGKEERPSKPNNTEG